MSIRIRYVAERFPAGTTPNTYGYLYTNWDEILWAAITVGRPNRQDVLRHGTASIYEILFRWSLVRMALEQGDDVFYPYSRSLVRTSAARTLDPTEKGAVSYFLGMTFCKLFAHRFLNTPWLLHLDVYRPQLDPVLEGRSRPDLVGKHAIDNSWAGFECKGRASPPSREDKLRAKTQARRLVSIEGRPCSLNVAAFTFLKKEVLEFYWCDPKFEEKEQIVVPTDPDVWRHYYEPIRQLIESYSQQVLGGNDEPIELEECDVAFQVYPPIAKLLLENQSAEAHALAVESQEEIKELGFMPDGIKIIAGQSWQKPTEQS